MQTKMSENYNFNKHEPEGFSYVPKITLIPYVLY